MSHQPLPQEGIIIIAIMKLVVLLCRDAVLGRYNRLKQLSLQRMKKLQDSSKLQVFLQEVTEASNN